MSLEPLLVYAPLTEAWPDKGLFGSTCATHEIASVRLKQFLSKVQQSTGVVDSTTACGRSPLVLGAI